MSNENTCNFIVSKYVDRIKSVLFLINLNEITCYVKNDFDGV